MRKGYRGFTLVELLVVIAIIGILIALMIPAVQSARESARRAQCQNNLTQLNFAVANYELLYRTYPMGTQEPKGPIDSIPLGYHHSWITQILPQLEQPAAFAAIDWKVGVYHPQNLAVRRTSIVPLQCPSSTSPYGAFSCYAGVHHDVEAPIDADNQGVFVLNGKLRYDDLQDGLTQCLFLGEKNPDQWDLGWMSGTRSTLRNMGDKIQAYSRTTWFNGINAWQEDLSRNYGDPTPADLAAVASRPRPNPGNAYLGNPFAVGGFGSYHRGGALFSFGDGAVKFLPEYTDLKVLRRLAHRSDGQLVSGY